MPIGECVFREEDKKIIFLIGGIGITPVISIMEYIMDKDLDTDTRLFYSNRTEEDIAFRKKLDNWRSINKNIEVYYTITDCQPKDKACISGYINKELIQERIDDLDERIIFIYGPPGMVKAMRKISLDIGAKTENIRSENFLGY